MRDSSERQCGGCSGFIVKFCRVWVGGWVCECFEWLGAVVGGVGLLFEDKSDFGYFLLYLNIKNSSSIEYVPQLSILLYIFM